ncbi:hypothetical protein CYMTET_21101, partial [Cymbomonas tetramitiformis]
MDDTKKTTVDFQKLLKNSAARNMNLRQQRQFRAAIERASQRAGRHVCPSCEDEGARMERQGLQRRALDETSSSSGELFNLTILHYNDIHSRYEPINRYDSTCDWRDEASAADCEGGVARVAWFLNNRSAELEAAGEKVLVLDAGDQFQGTLFYTLWKGEANADIMGMYKREVDVMASGNHEWDDGDANFQRFVENVSFPVCSANVDVTRSSEFEGAFSMYGDPATKLTKTVGGGVRLFMENTTAVIAVLAEDTYETSAPSENVTFDSIVNTLQLLVQDLEDNHNVTRIVVLSHAGASRDAEVAAAVGGIDAIVGGHTHVLLSPATEIVDPRNLTVPIVQAEAYGRYVGELRLTFDGAGDVVKYEAQYHRMTVDVPEDPEIWERVVEYADVIQNETDVVVGAFLADGEGHREYCRTQECSLGNVVCDAYLTSTLATNTKARLCLSNGGGIRASIGEGNVTRGMVMEVLPYQNTLAALNITGRNLRIALEQGVQKSTEEDWEDLPGAFPQVAGMRFVYNISAERYNESADDPPVRYHEGSRISNLTIMGEDGKYVDVEPDAHYVLMTQTYLAGGGDGYTVLEYEAEVISLYGELDYDVLSNYIDTNTPPGVTPLVEGRIDSVVERTPPSDSPTAAPTAAPTATATPTATAAPTQTCVADVGRRKLLGKGDVSEEGAPVKVSFEKLVKNSAARNMNLRQQRQFRAAIERASQRAGRHVCPSCEDEGARMERQGLQRRALDETSSSSGELFNLTILHYNDIHSRYEPINRYDSTCDWRDEASAADCEGGVARVAWFLNNRSAELEAAGEKVLVLDAGDQFQGTLFYTLWKGEANADIMGMYKREVDVMASGNHEWDDGDANFQRFVENVSFPVCSANVDVTRSSEFEGAFSMYGDPATKLTKTVGGGVRLFMENTTAVIAVLAEDTQARPKRARLREVRWMGWMEAGSHGQGRIVVLSHAGASRDAEVAAAVGGIDAIVGGHTHVLLSPATEIVDPRNLTVPIVQAEAYGRYVGELRLTFDGAGDVVKYEAQYHRMTVDVPEDPEIWERVVEYADVIQNETDVVVGAFLADGEGHREYCRTQECSLGNVVCDAYLTSTLATNTKARLCLSNGGGIRASIGEGNVTRGMVMEVLPYQNTLAALNITGRNLRIALEQGVQKSTEEDWEDLPGAFPQVAGMRFVYNISAERYNESADDPPVRYHEGSRISNLTIMGEDGKYVDVEPDAHYVLMTQTYLAGGGDGYTVLEYEAEVISLYGELDYDVLSNYIDTNTPPGVTPLVEGRIDSVVERTPPSDSPTAAPTAAPTATATPTATAAPTQTCVADVGRRKLLGKGDVSEEGAPVKVSFEKLVKNSAARNMNLRQQRQFRAAIERASQRAGRHVCPSCEDEGARMERQGLQRRALDETSSSSGELFNLTILHYNDIHSRYEPINRYDSTCDWRDEASAADCEGGVARVAWFLNNRSAELEAAGEKVLVLDAGDQFQGTLFYTLWKGEANADIMGMYKREVDVMASGNHEWDDGDANFQRFVENVSFPVCSANVDVTRSSEFEGAFSMYGDPATKLTKTVGGGVRLFMENTTAVIAVLAEDTGAAGWVMRADSAVCKEDGVRLDVWGRRRPPLIGRRARSVHASGKCGGWGGLRRGPTGKVACGGGGGEEPYRLWMVASAGCFYKRERGREIVVLSHAGASRDAEVAAAVGGIDAIVGGHTHVLLSPATEIVDPRNLTVPIVQAEAYGRYVGELRLTFDGAGDVVEYEAQYHRMTVDVPEDPEIWERVVEYADVIQNETDVVVGAFLADGEGHREYCRTQECSLGNVVCDAYLTSTLATNTKARLCLSNGGGIRASIGEGNVTRGMVMEVLPYQNTLAALNITGRNLRIALEQGVQKSTEEDWEDLPGAFPQVAGMRFVYNISAERYNESADDPPVRYHEGSRISNLTIMGEDGKYVDVEPDAHYVLMTQTYLAGGGDGYTVLEYEAEVISLYGELDYDVLSNYIDTNTPPGVTPLVEGRIDSVVERTPPSDSPTAAPTAAPTATATPTATAAPTQTCVADVGRRKLLGKGDVSEEGAPVKVSFEKLVKNSAARNMNLRQQRQFRAAIERASQRAGRHVCPSCEDEGARMERQGLQRRALDETSSSSGELFNLTILHYNDIHSRYEPINRYDSTCDWRDEASAADCEGGVARVAWFLNNRSAELEAAGEKVLVLDAGDQFQGTLFYTLWKGEANADIMGMYKREVDVMASGNHEWDDGDANFQRFVENVSFPVCSANVDVTRSSEFEGAFSMYGDPATKLTKTVGGGVRLFMENTTAVIAVLAEDTGAAGWVMRADSAVCKEDGVRLDVWGRRRPPLIGRRARSVRASGKCGGWGGWRRGPTGKVACGGGGGEEPYRLWMVASAGCFYKRERGREIVVLSHAGASRDAEVAAAVGGIDAIVGGHTHVLLSPATEIVDPRNLTVPIVQAEAYGRYVGELRLTFDGAGDVVKYEAQYHRMTVDVPEDPEIWERVVEYADVIQNETDVVVGAFLADGEGHREYCRTQECSLGNVVCDAYLTSTLATNTKARLCLSNGGGIRASIGEGNVTRGMVMEVLPYQNTLAALNITGRNLRIALEQGVQKSTEEDWEDLPGAFPQVAGMRFVYNISAERYNESADDPPVRYHEGSRISNLTIMGEDGKYVDVEPDAHYVLMTQTYLAGGGDGYTVLEYEAEVISLYGELDYDVLSNYIDTNTPPGVTPLVEGRIDSVVERTPPSDSPTAAPTAAPTATATPTATAAPTQTCVADVGRRKLLGKGDVSEEGAPVKVSFEKLVKNSAARNMNLRQQRQFRAAIERASQRAGRHVCPSCEDEGARMERQGLQRRALDETSSSSGELFNLTILHYNDIHSRYEPINRYDSTCDWRDEASAADCEGGVARVAWFLNNRSAELEAAGEKVLVLDAGDQFQGTLFYTLWKGEANADIMGMYKREVDVMASGNHEWDDGDANFQRFVENVSFPVCSANVDVTRSSEFEGAFSMYGDPATKLTKTVGGGVRLFMENTTAVIAVLAEDTYETSNPSENVTFDSIVNTLQLLIADLEQCHGVHRIVVLSHAGASRDAEVAAAVGG